MRNLKRSDGGLRAKTRNAKLIPESLGSFRKISRVFATKSVPDSCDTRERVVRLAILANRARRTEEVAGGSSGR